MVMAGAAAERMLGLEDGIGHQPGCVLVLQPVEDLLPLLPRRHYASQAQLGKLLRDGGRRLVDHFGESADGKFVRILQREDNPHTCRVSEHPEDLHRKLDV